MKQLLLVRHAKSSWDNPSLPDFARPLNERGLKDAPKVGKYLYQKGVKPDALISSPANRAHTTATLIAQELHYPIEKITTNFKLYVFSYDVSDVLPVITGLPDTYNFVMLFGHNPTFTELANYFTHRHFPDENPTCSVVALEFNTPHWQLASPQNARLMWHVFPKML